MAVDESTQTDGVPGARESNAGRFGPGEARKSDWEVEDVLKTLPKRYALETDSPVPFFNLISRLKTTKRAGWVRMGVNECESISDHMYRMSIMTMLAPSSLTSKLDVPRCTKMALVHDMAEALVGDITPADKVEKKEKSRRETAAMDYICNEVLGKYNGGLNGKELKEVWQEYEDDQTMNAHFVHDIDKMELLLQTLEYEREHGPTTDLGEFTWVYTKIKLQGVRDWADCVLWQRHLLWESFGKEPKWATGQQESTGKMISTKPNGKPASYVD